MAESQGNMCRRGGTLEPRTVNEKSWFAQFCLKTLEKWNTGIITGDYYHRGIDNTEFPEAVKFSCV